MLRALLLSLALLAAAGPLAAQESAPDTLSQTGAAIGPLQALLQENAALVAEPSRRTVGEVLALIVESEIGAAPQFLEVWRARNVWQRKDDGLFFYTEGSDPLTLIDIDTGETVGEVPKGEMTNLKPNSGVQSVIATALVQFQLQDPDPARRMAALDSIARDGSEEQLAPLIASMEEEDDPAILARKERLALILTARFGDTSEERVAAIEELAGDTAIETRATLNQILATTDKIAAGRPPAGENIAAIRRVGGDLSADAAYDLLVREDLARPRVSDADIAAALAAAIVDGRVGEVPVATLSTEAARIRAYEALADAGAAPPFISDGERDEAVAAHSFYTAYRESDAAVTEAAGSALAAIQRKVSAQQFADITLDALSLASIYFLAAIGLAITFGVMGVINMAHGEFIMMGAYTGYVVQLFVPDYTVSLLVAFPLAFLVTFAAGVLMERLVIRWLYHRPLETLLATFGISIALQQLAKNIFGTQARPLTSPDWLGGAMVINDVISIAWIRVAIFVLALVILGLLLFVLGRTRLGLEVRAVTQNPGMAASMGINPDRINMLTFGLGSGIAGIAGVSIGLYAKVTSELGSDYIVQSFMTVVVGGVGNVWGTLAGAAMIGFLQKGIEWFNPSNTLAAQTYMILFIILFIQFRPKGIVALKGRAAGD